MHATAHDEYATDRGEQQPAIDDSQAPGRNGKGMLAMTRGHPSHRSMFRGQMVRNRRNA